MEKSEQINELAGALSMFQCEMEFVGYDANNPFFKSKYATLTALVTESKKLLGKYGLSVTQLTEDQGSVITMLMHKSGQWISSKLTLTPSKQDPQGLGSAISYARRYSYASILGLVSDQDDDANHATFGKPATSAPKLSQDAPYSQPEDLTLLGTIRTMAKAKFKTPDDFKLFRVDNGFPDDITTMSDLELGKLLSALRNKK